MSPASNRLDEAWCTIFRSLDKEEDDSRIVTMDTLISSLSRMFKGILSPNEVQEAVIVLSRKTGMASEIAFFDEKEFNTIMNRIFEDCWDSLAQSTSEEISKKDLTLFISSTFTLPQIFLMKKHLKKTFDNLINLQKAPRKTISKQEMKETLVKVAVGEISLSRIISWPKFFRLLFL